MEKISSIVRGNSRVSTSDLKSSGAVRPGALSFGRPIGESPQGPEANRMSTAERAAGLQADMTEMRKAHTNDRMVADMADSFFMTRVRRPDDPVAVPAASTVKISSAKAQAEDAIEELSGGAMQDAAEIGQPQGYVPRGTYVNVRA